jgi:hypothetical protein
LLNEDIKYHNDKYVRILHNLVNESYTIGRYGSFNHTISNNTELHVIWLAYYPLNELLLKRKLQIKNNMSEFDKQHGLGFQHLFSKDKMLSINPLTI